MQRPRIEEMMTTRGCPSESSSPPWLRPPTPPHQRNSVFISPARGNREPSGAYVLEEREQQADGCMPLRQRNPSRDRDLPNRIHVSAGDQVFRTPPRPAFPTDRCPQQARYPTYIVASAAPSYGVQEFQIMPTPPRSLPQATFVAALPCPAVQGAGSNFYQATGTTLPPFCSSGLSLQVSPSHPIGPFRRSTATSNASATTSKASKKAWWTRNHFLVTHDENMVKSYVCRACNAKRSGKQSSSRLAEHLWQCGKVDASIKSQLHEDSAHIRSVVRKYSGGGNSFVPGTNEKGMGGRKRHKGVSPTKPAIEECTDSEADAIAMQLVRSVVEFCLPLTIFDNPQDKLNSFREAFLLARPGFRHKYPSRHAVMAHYLPRLYSQTLAVVKRSLKQMLSSGFGTIIFDGWDDITRASVVNILLRVESKSTRKTFFLESVFTGHSKVGAAEYVAILERAMSDFGGLGRICGVTSDSARACVNARNELGRKYMGLIGVQDQAHVADLLMKDIGKLDFVKDILDKVNLLVVETRGKRKLLHFLRDEIKRENKRTRQEEENEGVNGEHPGSTLPSDPLDPERLFPPLRKTAIMLRRPAATRFASISDTLEAFIRCRDVLGRVILDPKFDRDLFPSDKPGQEDRRDVYKSLVSSVPFLESVKEVHNIFRLCRRYLRIFDQETGTSIADVVPRTEFLGQALDRLPTSDNVLTPERLETVKGLFRRRKDGPIGGRGIQVRLIEDVHIAACLLHPTMFLHDYEHYNHRFYSFIKRFVKSYIPSPTGETDSNIENSLEEKRVALINKMMDDYDQIHSRWMLATPRNDSSEPRLNENAVMNTHDEFAYRSSPMRFWNEEKRVGNCSELCELALRTLSISPSSCAAERSFSAQGRIRTKLRNRLGDEVVRKMIFVKWNIKHYDEAMGSSTRKRNTAKSEGLRNDGQNKDILPSEESFELEVDVSDSESSDDELLDLVDDDM